MTRWTLFAATVAMSAATPAFAGTAELPAGLTFCDDRAAIEEKLGPVNELTDEMLEVNIALWGLDGVIRIVLNEGGLVTARFRVFESPDSVKVVKSRLEKALGAPTTVGEADGETGLYKKYTWAPGDSVTVEMTRQSDQLYATWQAPPVRCASAVEEQIGLTDQEKADIAGTEKKKAIEFDVFSEDLDEREKEIEDEKKAKAEAEEKKAKAEEGEDDEEKEAVDIDW